MPTYKIRAEEIVTYEIEVEAESVEEAIAAVEDGDEADLYEVDSSGFTAKAYTIPGQIGWNMIDTEETDT
jgi:hypothetical protein